MSRSKLERLQQLIDKKPDDPFPRYGWAMEQKRLGELESAIGAFGRLLEDFPDYIAAYYHYAGSLIEAEREQDASTVLEQGIEVAARQGNTHARDEMQALLDGID